MSAGTKEAAMSGPMRWAMFFAIIVLGGAGVVALWSGLSIELLKAVATFAILGLASFALYGVAAKR